MPAATILFMDIVGFSKKPTTEQYRLVNTLTSEVIYKLRPLLMPPTTVPGIIAMPTGDGMALAFLHRPEASWNANTIYSLILDLQKWASNQTTSNVRLRMGVHVGAVEFVTDINGKLNVCGDTINYAQRIMDAANPMQVLFSENAFREYVGEEKTICETPPFSSECQAAFSPPIELFAKHGMRIAVHKLSLEPQPSWWCNEDPMAKHLMTVRLTELPKEIVGSFADRIKSAAQIAFIQLTGDRVLSAFNEGKLELSENLKKLWVFMPHPDVYGSLNLDAERASSKFVNEYVEGWKSFLVKLRADRPQLDAKLGLFKEPPYFGASFIDWEAPKGTIHVSPYVWGTSAKLCPGYDLEWIGHIQPEVYAAYVKGLDYLNAQTKNEIVSG